MSQPINKAMRVLALIKEGGATKESLMAGIDVNKAGLASQLSALNARGLNIAEVDESKAEFPMVDEKGIFYMGTLEQYTAKRSAAPGVGKKALTKEELIEFAQKREDKASATATKAKDKLEANPSDSVLALRAKIAEAQLELASAMLSAVERGDYQYEHVTIKAA